MTVFRKFGNLSASSNTNDKWQLRDLQPVHKEGEGALHSEAFLLSCISFLYYFCFMSLEKNLHTRMSRPEVMLVFRQLMPLSLLSALPLLYY